MLRGAHEKVADGLPGSVPYPEPGTGAGKLLHALTVDVIQMYNRAMKRAIAFHKLEHDADARARCEALRLPLPVRAAAPYYGKIGIPAHPYLDRRAQVAVAHYSAPREVLTTFVWLYSNWESTFAPQRFVETALPSSRLALPCELAPFVELQAEACKAYADSLRMDWRQAFAEQLVDNVQDVYDFFQSNAAAYRGSQLSRLLKHFEVRMAHQLRTAVHATLEDWVGFVTLHTDGDPASGAPPPLDPEFARLFGGATAAPDDGAVPVDENLEPLAGAEPAIGGLRNEWGRPLHDFPTTGRVPLFAVELVASEVDADGEPVVVLRPSVDEIEASLLAAIDAMVTGVRDFATLDSDLMSLLHLEPRKLFDIDVGNPLFAEVDAELASARDSISARIAEAAKGPLRLMSMYAKFAPVMAISTPEHVAQFVATQPELDEYVAHVREFHEAAAAIQATSEDTELFALLSVDTRPAKADLRAKALEVRDALLENVILVARAQNEQWIARCEQILAASRSRHENELQKPRTSSRSRRARSSRSSPTSRRCTASSRRSTSSATACHPRTCTSRGRR